MMQRELEYRIATNLVCYSTLLRRMGVKRPTFYVILPSELA
jgi:hypothetical protein